MLYWLFMLPAILISGIAQVYVIYAFSKWKGRAFRMSGQEVAEYILSRNGIHAGVQRYVGFLSDHYDPSAKVVRLSPDVYDRRTIASAAVAAHECGHALQHHAGYLPLKLRTALVPVVNIGSYLAWILIVLGFAIGLAGLVLLGIIIFSISVLFALITLPVEFDASIRGMRELEKMGLSEEDRSGVREVLVAAALTYVAAFITALLELAYYLFIFSTSRD